MLCSIKNCDGLAIEEITLDSGQIKGFCGKNYYHTANGWVISLNADRKYKQTEKGKLAYQKTSNRPKFKEKHRQSCREYYASNKEKWQGYNRFYSFSLTKEQMKEKNRKHWLNISAEAKEKHFLENKRLREAIKKCGLTVKQYYQFKKDLIQIRGNKCQKCNCSEKEKRLILHHKKQYYPNFKLLIKESNCVILCDKCHRLLHSYAEEN